jgi:hypothetical protein
MPAKRRHGGSRHGSGGYEPGGASRHRLSGILNRSGKRQIAEIIERKSIVGWHDAASIRSNADPGEFFIK